MAVKYFLKCLFALGVLIWPVNIAAQTTEFAPVAIINDQVITQYDVTERIKVLRFAGFGDNISQETALEQLIEEALVAHGARLQGLEMSQQMVDQAFGRLAQGNGISTDELFGRVSAAGISQQSFGQLLGSQTLWRQTAQRRFAASARPTDADIDNTLLEIALAAEREVRLSEIAFPFSERGDAGTRQFLNELYEALNSGASFADLARQYSRTVSAANGGDTGWIAISELPPAMQAPISALPVGQISQPLPVTNGISILLVTDDRERLSDAAEQVLLSYSQADYMSQEDARAARASFEVCTSTEIRSNQQSRTPLQPITEAPEIFIDSLASMPIGQVSQPIKTNEGFALVQLCARTVNATLEERNAVADRLFSERASSYAESYLQTLRREALIERR